MKNSNVDASEKVIGANIPEEESKIELADFETAISATGFGTFNFLLILVAIPSGWASMFESSTVSYIIPVAECDLDLSLEDKGYLISATYLGMLCSSIVWGFLSDTLGRKRILVIGLFLAMFFTLLAGVSQTYAMLMFSKFMGGFIANGPFAVLTTVISEYHCAKNRPRILLAMGIVFGSGNALLPLLAWNLLPSTIVLQLFDGAITLRSWNLFILVTGLPSLLGALGHWFLIPETPKFLMTSGRNEDALRVFQHIYTLNTGKPPSSFPVMSLIDEKLTNERSAVSSNKMEALQNGFTQMKAFFCKPHRSKIILVCFLQMGTLGGLNSLRLWLPQLFTAIFDYKSMHPFEDTDICRVLGSMSENNTLYLEDVEPICGLPADSSGVYTNMIIVACGSMVFYVVLGFVVNILGKKRVYILLAITSGVFGLSLFFSTEPIMVTVLSSIFISLGGVNANVLLTIIVDLFPTNLRTMSVCVSLMMGRFGAMMGSIIFPILIQTGCFPPFLFIGSIVGGCGCLALLLPNTDLKPLV